MGRLIKLKRLWILSLAVLHRRSKTVLVILALTTTLVLGSMVSRRADWCRSPTLFQEEDENNETNDGKNCTFFHIPQCGCQRRVCRNVQKDIFLKDEESIEAATYLGRRQKVISYSVFGEGEGIDFLKGVPLRYCQMKKVYPNWVMRLYTNLSLQRDSILCQYACRAKDFYYCDVNALPVLGNISSSFGMTWRFVPLADPTVTWFLSRDLGSALIPREARSVSEWERSHKDKTFHIIRDNPLHKFPVLGRTFGVRTEYLSPEPRREMLSSLLEATCNSTTTTEDGCWSQVQRTLTKVIYQNPKFAEDFLSHDRFFCSLFNQTPSSCVPFPLKDSFLTWPYWTEDYVGGYDIAVQKTGFEMETWFNLILSSR